MIVSGHEYVISELHRITARDGRELTKILVKSVMAQRTTYYHLIIDGRVIGDVGTHFVVGTIKKVWANFIDTVNNKVAKTPRIYCTISGINVIYNEEKNEF